MKRPLSPDQVPRLHTMVLRALALALLGIQTTYSAVFFQNAAHLPQDAEYDFIIAGGGTGGGVVAARLAENPNWKILVVEAGRSNKDVFQTIPPGLCPELVKSSIDWNYTTVPQAGANGRSAAYSRAKILGGCSSHNGMVYTRGAKDDWNKWAEITGDDALAWDNILPLIFKAEHLVVDSEGQPLQGRLDPSLHGHNGNVTKELPHEFPFVLDFNGGTQIGVAWNQFTIDGDSQRSSSATAFDRDTALAEWNATRSGPLTVPGHLKNQIIAVRLPDDAPPFSQYGFDDPTPGPTAPHLEIYHSAITQNLPNPNGQVPIPPEVGNITTVQLSAVNVHPKSRGSVTLNSSDPFAYPNIDVGLLSEDVDLAIMREVIRSARRLYEAPVFKNSVFGSVYPAANITSDEDLNEFIRGVAGPYLHGSSSAAMSPRGVSWGVVDPDFRVKGTAGLRVVDASVLPTVPSGHTQAPVFGFAERASLLIRKVWE
ncbi:Pyridoxine 4-oxidase [Leucoagaricus sp. SymC.cos]|nr:Pyridoxine 4-oxidase [Leucoagaricus sp. SymC.cos]